MKPSTLEEAVALIQSQFPAEQLSEWAKESEDMAGVLAHFDLAMWIRNNWVYGDGSPLSDKIRQQALFIDADGISSVIVSALWRHLNGMPCGSIAEHLMA